MKLLKSSIEKENDDHDVFGAYVSMEIRNLKTSKAQEKLRTEIRDAISRIVREESTTVNDGTCFSNLNKNSEEQKKIDLSNSSLTSNINNCDDSFFDKKKIRKSSWELI